MTDEIAAHVLAHNYDQTLALSLLEAEAVDDLGAQAAFMDDLEARGPARPRRWRACRAPPRSPSAAKAGKGLTRPELAVLLAYGKLDLCEDVVASPARTIRTSSRP